jgi:hypothetical protein
MTGARFEISIDGVPRTYRDRKDLALLAAQILGAAVGLRSGSPAMH